MKSIFSFIGIISAALLASCSDRAAAEDESFRYYCPKSGVDLMGNQNYLMGSGSTQFPSRLGSVPGGIGPSPTFSWSFEDCSNQENYCLDARVGPDDRPTRIFAPRKMEIGRVYESGNARALVIGSTSHIPQRAQIVIWQPSGLEDAAMKITVEDGRGIVFIDGINFWHPDLFRDGETCALESKSGYFGGIKVPISPITKKLPS